MGPSKVIPYYFKATLDDNNSNDPDQVTISTLVTHNRFKVLGRLASHYKGPISAAIHVNDDETKQSILTDLHKLYDQNHDMRRYVDIHLIVDKVRNRVEWNMKKKQYMSHLLFFWGG
jgi:glycosyltransferase-like protein LARGE